MKRALVVVLACTLGLVGCGGGGSTTKVGTTGLKTRAFITNAFAGLGAFAGTIELVNYQNDSFANFRITAGNKLTTMVLSPDRLHTAVLDTASTIDIVDNAKEIRLGSQPLSDWTESFAWGTDNKTLYAAVRNTPNPSAAPNSLPGAIEYFDITATTVVLNKIFVPLVRRVAISPDGKTMLALSPEVNTATLIDLTTNAIKSTVQGTFDSPVAAFFSSDNAKVYVLNCGPQCGGTTAGVNAVDVTTATANAIVPAPGALIGTMDGTNLYVAGNNSTGAAMLTLFTLNGGTVTVNGASIQLGGGTPTVMQVGPSNKLFIGEQVCSTGCLNVVDLGTRTNWVDSAKGDVTGMDAVPNRNVMYVIEGAVWRVYDASQSNPDATVQSHNVFGQPFDVKIIDK